MTHHSLAVSGRLKDQMAASSSSVRAWVAAAGLLALIAMTALDGDG